MLTKRVLIRTLSKHTARGIICRRRRGIRHSHDTKRSARGGKGGTRTGYDGTCRGGGGSQRGEGKRLIPTNPKHHGNLCVCIRQMFSTLLIFIYITSCDSAQMEAEIAQQNKIQASIRQETYLLKKSANELKDQIANLSIALRELQAEERQLSKEIVLSPDRIKVDLADAIQRLERVKKTIVEKQNEKHTVQKMLKHTASAEESVRQVITTDLRELETKLRAYKLAVKELNEAQNKLRGMEQDLEEKKQVKEMQIKELEAVGKFGCRFAFCVVACEDSTTSRAYTMYHPACFTLSFSLSLSLYRKTQSRNQSRPHQNSPIDTN